MGRFSTVANELRDRLLSIGDATTGIGEPYIGKVLIGNPYIDNWAEYLAKTRVTTVNNLQAVRVWIIDRKSRAETWETTTQSYVEELWSLKCWFGYHTEDLNEAIASEPIFNDVIDDVFDKLREDYHMTKGDTQLFDTRDGPKTNTDLDRLGQLGMVKCHFCEITFRGTKDETF